MAKENTNIGAAIVDDYQSHQSLDETHADFSDMPWLLVVLASGYWQSHAHSAIDRDRAIALWALATMSLVVAVCAYHFLRVGDPPASTTPRVAIAGDGCKFAVSRDRLFAGDGWTLAKGTHLRAGWDGLGVSAVEVLDGVGEGQRGYVRSDRVDAIP